MATSDRRHCPTGAPPPLIRTMSRIAYVIAATSDRAPAVPVEDRGLQFADGVYEVIKVRCAAAPCDLERHLDRLERSLAALRDPACRPAARRSRRSSAERCVATGCATRRSICRSTAASRRAITCSRRGPRPTPDRRPSAAAPAQAGGTVERGVGVITLPDQRWKRCDIKSVSLLAEHPGASSRRPRPAAARSGCTMRTASSPRAPAPMPTSSTRDGRLVTRPLGHADPGRRHPRGGPGARRGRKASRSWSGRSPSRRRTRRARPSSPARRSLVLPVTAIDGRTVANGMPGSITSRLLERYRDHLMTARDKACHLWLCDVAAACRNDPCARWLARSGTRANMIARLSVG